MTSREKLSQRVSRSRVVTYTFENDRGFPFDCEERLARAKRDGVVTEYDDGRNCWPWFSGKPSAALRALRDEFEKGAKGDG